MSGTDFTDDFLYDSEVDSISETVTHVHMRLPHAISAQQQLPVIIVDCPMRHESDHTHADDFPRSTGSREREREFTAGKLQPPLCCNDNQIMVPEIMKFL